MGHNWVADVVRRVQALEDRGWRIVRRYSGHHTIFAPNGQATTLAGSPSDNRAKKNTEAWLRRNGIENDEQLQRLQREKDRLERIAQDRRVAEAATVAAVVNTAREPSVQTKIKMKEVAVAEKKVSRRGPTIANEVIKVIADAGGTPVAVETIQRVTGLSREQVQKVVTSHRNRNDLPVEIVVKGRMWRWVGDRPTTWGEMTDERLAQMHSAPKQSAAQAINERPAEVLGTAPQARPAPAPGVGDTVVFELVGKTKTGRMIIRDEDGNLYEAREME